MIDGHIHFEFQDYNLKTIELMVHQAMARGITEMHLLDHTHKFIEFDPIYQPILSNAISKAWYERQQKISIQTYLDFIHVVRQQTYPVTILFGLEVCYIPQSEAVLKSILSQYSFDFLIGSVHYIDDIGFDISKEAWVGHDIDWMYRRYYEIMEQLIESRLFTSLGHPDSIKLYRHYPSYDLRETYHRLAQTLIKYQLKTENNSGLSRYQFDYPGLNPILLSILKEAGVHIETSSDAHKYQDIGKDFNDLIHS